MHCWAIHIVVATLCGKEGLKPWECSLVPRPHPDFSPRLRDKIWVGPGDEATSLQQSAFKYVDKHGHLTFEPHRSLFPYLLAYLECFYFRMVP